MARVLLCGEVRGRVSELHRLLHQLQKKGPFDLAICTGSFFAAPEEPGGSPECSSFSPEENPPEGHPSPQDAPQKALGEAVCNALSDQFAVAFEELKGCSRSLPIPLYILDEAASRCVQRLQTQRPKEGHPPAAAPPSSTTERHHKVKTEDASADAATIDATPSEGLSADVKAEPNGDTSPGEEKSGADSDNPHQSCSVVSGTRDCTYTPLQLLDNVWVLAGAGVAELHGLNIAFYGGQGPPELACSMSNAPSHQQQQQEDPQQKEQNGADDRVATFALSLENGWGGFSAFRGSTDILLTTRPPLGMFDGLPPGVVPAFATQQQKRQQQQQQDESPGANREKGGLVDGKVEASSTEFEGR
ncbi:hypothetical protein, conserved [Eimeria maxima]|uniref:Uncharacterized protein n=1 Tax=Eimeria maxima TaxID=5804 RepID=U6M912_EIMMA|nr:hypothetical protein, conserved [Eimeria maxima]CDJ60697.1 hypothetical protein, conserved [Eimeria maxima]